MRDDGDSLGHLRRRLWTAGRVLPWAALVAAIVLIWRSPVAAAANDDEPKTWKYQGGRWPQVQSNQPATTQAVDPQLYYLDQLITQGQYDSARLLTITWLRNNHGSPLYDRGLMLEAEALYGVGNRIKAFYYLDELMDEYPTSPLYYAALQRQYDIADAYLNGFKDKLFGFRILGRNEEAVEMLYRIQQRSPGSPLAEKALLRTCDFYYADGQYDLATDAYGAYIRDFPRSDLLPRIKLRQAYSNLAQFRGLRYDATPVIDARAQLEQVLAEYPEFAADEKVPDVIQRIDHTFARKLLVTADFYKRTSKPRAAAYTYLFLIRTYPDLVEAKEARQYLARLPSWAQNMPEPAAGPVGQPTTERTYPRPAP